MAGLLGYIGGADEPGGGRFDPADPSYNWMLDWRPDQTPQDIQRYLDYLRQQQQGMTQPVQMPGTLADLSALTPNTPAYSSSWPRQAGAGDFSQRMTGPMSGNIVDQRTPITSQDVSNWLALGREQD